MNGQTRYPLWEWLLRSGGLITVLIAIIAFGIQLTTSQARIEEKFDAHLDFHPDTNLSRRIDRLEHHDRDHDMRIRQLEIRLGVNRDD